MYIHGPTFVGLKTRKSEIRSFVLRGQQREYIFAFAFQYCRLPDKAIILAEVCFSKTTLLSSAIPYLHSHLCGRPPTENENPVLDDCLLG